MNQLPNSATTTLQRSWSFTGLTPGFTRPLFGANAVNVMHVVPLKSGQSYQPSGTDNTDQLRHLIIIDLSGRMYPSMLVHDSEEVCLGVSEWTN